MPDLNRPYWRSVNREAVAEMRHALDLHPWPIFLAVIAWLAVLAALMYQNETAKLAEHIATGFVGALPIVFAGGLLFLYFCNGVPPRRERALVEQVAALQDRLAPRLRLEFDSLDPRCMEERGIGNNRLVRYIRLRVRNIGSDTVDDVAVRIVGAEPPQSYAYPLTCNVVLGTKHTDRCRLSPGAYEYVDLAYKVMKPGESYTTRCEVVLQAHGYKTTGIPGTPPYRLALMLHGHNVPALRYDLDLIVDDAHKLKAILWDIATVRTAADGPAGSALTITVHDERRA